MAIGPGKYDAIATMAREQAEAEAVVVILFNGKHGDGFSVQQPVGARIDLPALLRLMADQIERDIRPQGTT